MDKYIQERQFATKMKREQKLKDIYIEMFIEILAVSVHKSLQGKVDSLLHHQAPTIELQSMLDIYSFFLVKSI